MNKIIAGFLEKYNLNSLEITDNPRELIIMLISDIKDCSIADVKLDKVTLTAEEINIIDEMIKNIVNENIPPQYLTNKAHIYGLEFYIDNNVLIPRQDTETLIEHAIRTIDDCGYKTALDMCTGSGIIGICIAENSSINKVLLADVSHGAINVCNRNIQSLGLEHKCSIIQSNMFEKLYALNTKYDIIVSNPPYLTNDEMKEISTFVQKEPALALYGGRDGLQFYRTIFSEGKKFLNNNGTIMVEIGYAQAQDVLNIISEHKEYTDVRIIQDINLKDRVIICRFQNK